MYLYATPKLDLRDFKVVSILDNNYKNGLFTLDAEIQNYSYYDTPVTVSAEILDANGTKVLGVETTKPENIPGTGKHKLSLKGEVQNVAQWSAEIPNLYSLVLTMTDKDGKVLEVIKRKIGFRSSEIT